MPDVMLPVALRAEPRDLVVLSETHLVAGSLDGRSWVGEIDRDGEIVWSSTLGLEAIADAGRIERMALREDDSFVVLVSHVQRAVPHDYHHVWLGRIDARGTVLDAIEIHGEWGALERDFGLVVLEDDDVVVAGRVRCGDDQRPYLGRFRFRFRF